VLRVHLEQVLGKQQSEMWRLGSNSAVFEGCEEKRVREESHTEMCSNSLDKKLRLIFNFLTAVFQVTISQVFAHSVNHFKVAKKEYFNIIGLLFNCYDI